MKKNADHTAAAHAAYDKGGAKTSPSNPTRVGSIKPWLFALLMSVFLTGCGATIRTQLGSITFPQSRGGGCGPSMMRPPQPRFVQPNYGVPYPVGYPGANPFCGNPGYGPRVAPQYNNAWLEAPTYRPGCGIMRPEQGGSIWAQPSQWTYEYARETRDRHLRGGPPVFGR